MPTSNPPIRRVWALSQRDAVDRPAKPEVAPTPPKPKKAEPPPPKPVVEASPSVVASPPGVPKSRSNIRWSRPTRKGCIIHEQPGRDDLKATSQHVSDIPLACNEPGNPRTVFGDLELVYAVNHRPLLVLRVPPMPILVKGKTQQSGTRYFPWRFDWGGSVETASRRTMPFGDLWLVLNPAHMAEHQEVWLRGKMALEEWAETRPWKKKSRSVKLPV